VDLEAKKKNFEAYPWYCSPWWCPMGERG